MKVCDKCSSKKISKRLEIQSSMGINGWGVIYRGDLCRKCFKLLKGFMKLTIPDSEASDV